MLRCRWTHFLSSGASRRKDYPWQFKNSNAQLCIVSIISSPIKSYSKLHSIHFFPKYFVSESTEGIADSHKSSYILSLPVFQSEKVLAHPENSCTLRNTKLKFSIFFKLFTKNKASNMSNITPLTSLKISWNASTARFQRSIFPLVSRIIEILRKKWKFLLLI